MRGAPAIPPRRKYCIATPSSASLQTNLRKDEPRSALQAARNARLGMSISSARLRYKIVTSFAFAALCLVALVRLAMAVPMSGAALAAFALGALLVAAAAWRGIIYMRLARSLARP
jgi:hypothetical protein